jgi:very-short-patch-repair endonuclease
MFQGVGMIPYNKNLVSNARQLRKNMTPEEKHLWYDFLKRLPYNVRRQHNICNYIVDFYIAQKKVVIEIDGVQHTSDENKQADEQRDKQMAMWGIKVLRYSNKSIHQSFNAVTEDILKELGLQFSDLKAP